MVDGPETGLISLMGCVHLLHVDQWNLAGGIMDPMRVVSSWITASVTWQYPVRSMLLKFYVFFFDEKWMQGLIKAVIIGSSSPSCKRNLLALLWRPTQAGAWDSDRQCWESTINLEEFCRFSSIELSYLACMLWLVLIRRLINGVRRAATASVIKSWSLVRDLHPSLRPNHFQALRQGSHSDHQNSEWQCWAFQKLQSYVLL